MYLPSPLRNCKKTRCKQWKKDVKTGVFQHGGNRKTPGGRFNSIFTRKFIVHCEKKEADDAEGTRTQILHTFPKNQHKSTKHLHENHRRRQRGKLAKMQWYLKEQTHNVKPRGKNLYRKQQPKEIQQDGGLSEKK